VSVVALAVLAFVPESCLLRVNSKKMPHQSRGSPCAGHHRRGDRGSTEASSSRDHADADADDVAVVESWEETSLDSQGVESLAPKVATRRRKMRQSLWVVVQWRQLIPQEGGRQDV
jgi:hypothetical protein